VNNVCCWLAASGATCDELPGGGRRVLERKNAMSKVEKHFDSIKASCQWLSSLTLAKGDEVTVTITSAKDRRAQAKQAPTRKFSETSLCGLWRDRDDIQDVDRYVRELRKPRFTDVS
jgi:hypothetical protein